MKNLDLVANGFCNKQLLCILSFAFKTTKRQTERKKADSPLPAGCGTANPGSRKGTPVVTPAGFNSLTPYVVKEVIKLTKSFKASLDSASFACSNLKKIQ